jgi:hypothetical protein
MPSVALGQLKAVYWVAIWEGTAAFSQRGVS